MCDLQCIHILQVSRRPPRGTSFYQTISDSNIPSPPTGCKACCTFNVEWGAYNQERRDTFPLYRAQNLTPLCKFLFCKNGSAPWIPDRNDPRDEFCHKVIGFSSIFCREWRNIPMRLSGAYYSSQHVKMLFGKTMCSNMSIAICHIT